LSSVKAMAEPGECCADEDFPGQPETAYGQAKRATVGARVKKMRRSLLVLAPKFVRQRHGRRLSPVKTKSTLPEQKSVLR
ncbi:MAG: hypothetical protein J0L53_18465, partial [Spirochaetes bacterium]|nr:hypothetical protein [Spirochaetota bacterium]